MPGSFEIKLVTAAHAQTLSVEWGDLNWKDQVNTWNEDLKKQQRLPFQAQV